MSKRLIQPNVEAIKIELKGLVCGIVEETPNNLLEKVAQTLMYKSSHKSIGR